MGDVKVLLRNPRRELEFDGPLSVVALLGRLDLNRESVLVISSGTLVPGDALLADSDVVEIRPVISGGGERWSAPAGPAPESRRRVDR